MSPMYHRRNSLLVLSQLPVRAPEHHGQGGRLQVGKHCGFYLKALYFIITGLG